MLVREFLSEAAVYMYPAGVHIRSTKGTTLFKGSVGEFMNSQYNNCETQSWNWENCIKQGGEVFVCRINEI